MPSFRKFLPNSYTLLMPPQRIRLRAHSGEIRRNISWSKALTLVVNGRAAAPP
jgi:hypothetical protein